MPLSSPYWRLTELTRSLPRSVTDAVDVPRVLGLLRLAVRAAERSTTGDRVLLDPPIAPGTPRSMFPMAQQPGTRHRLGDGTAICRHRHDTTYLAVQFL